MARVLIIGATSAIAREVARIYAGRGAQLYLMARSAGGLARACAELGEPVVGSESGDFSEVAENAARIERALAALGGLDIAIIAHGWLGDQLRSEREFEEARETFAVNCMSVISFLIPLANAVEAQGHGNLAVMSSVAAERGRPRNYTYAAAKSAINVYLQGVRSRLWKSGGRVHILKLGPAHTPMTTHHKKNALFARPEAVAKGIVRAIDRGAGEAYIPAYWLPIMAVVRVLPEFVFQRIPFLSGR
jgi:decaprenylphospho-beta-D-erythro-pentofuranosid-2-ulose 2-reductase